MQTNAQSNPAPIVLPADVDPQGIIGSFLGKLAGGLVGKAAGGRTGSTIGSIAGGALGTFLPFSAGPDAGAAPVSELEMQGFWDTFKKITGVVAKTAGTVATVGHGLGLFEAGPNGAAPQQAVSELEMQGFWDTFKKITGVVAKTAGTVATVGHGLGLFQAQPAAPTAQIGEVELQNFYKVWNNISGVINAVSKIPPAQPTSGQATTTLSPDQAMAILRHVSPVLQTLLQRPAGPMN